MATDPHGHTKTKRLLSPTTLSAINHVCPSGNMVTQGNNISHFGGSICLAVSHITNPAQRGTGFAMSVLALLNSAVQTQRCWDSTGCVCVCLWQITEAYSLQAPCFSIDLLQSQGKPAKRGDCVCSAKSAEQIVCVCLCVSVANYIINQSINPFTDSSKP